MTKWEYARIGGSYGYKLDSMNLMGKNGWELVAMLDGYCYFKRPLGHTIANAQDALSLECAQKDHEELLRRRNDMIEAKRKLDSGDML